MSTLCPNSCRQTARIGGQLPPCPPVPYAYADDIPNHSSFCFNPWSSSTFASLLFPKASPFFLVSILLFHTDTWVWWWVLYMSSIESYYYFKLQSHFVELSFALTVDTPNWCLSCNDVFLSCLCYSCSACSCVLVNMSMCSAHNHKYQALHTRMHTRTQNSTQYM